MAEEISADVMKQVRGMLADAVAVSFGKDARGNVADFIEGMAPAASVAAIELAANPADAQAAFVLDGIKVQAVQMAAETGISLANAADAGLGIALDVGVRVLARVIRG